MGKRESTLLMFWGASAFWLGLLAAFATGTWIGYDLLHVDWNGAPVTASFGVRFVIAERCILLACCQMVSLLGGIVYRLSQAS